MVNLIMNVYAYYGRGHRIHSSGQIEWYTNTVDHKSVQVGGQQGNITIDGYSIPLVCKGVFGTPRHLNRSRFMNISC